MIRIISLAICLTLGTAIYSQNTNVVSSGGGTIDNGTLSLDQSIGELVVGDIIGANTTLEQGFQNTFLKVGIVIAAKAYLQGPFDGITNLMNDDLRSLGLVPKNSPYTDVATMTTQEVLDVVGNDAIVDWVFIEIRDRLVNDQVVAFQSALLQRDGDVVDIDGISPLKFELFPGTFFVSITHRNHLGVISNDPEMLTKLDDTFDFTTNDISTAGGSNARVTLSSGEFALWAGDGNNNGQVRFSGANNDANTIKDYILADPANFFNSVTFSSGGYLIEDVDMNGTARFSGSSNDSNIIKDNVLGHPGNFLNLPTFTISTSVPPQN